ncbi:multicopper oxidase family protein [Paenibacillus koleovorans]|uniref:multicopper oxidase family protein n=1 Tax=Paenibacillus koleovorans TaxID=121608 RepID=UPI001FE946F7|nr:multicopper oxidase family protein [Paenibacillus koleovorans]
MYALLLGLEYAWLFLLALLGWIAGKKASGLLYAGTAARMKQKARKQLSWALWLTLLSLAQLLSVGLLMSWYSQDFWEYPLYLRTPLLLLPMLAVLLVSVPMLLRLRHAAKAEGDADGPLSPELRRLASAPALVVPYQALGLGAATAFYFALVPPTSWLTLETAIPAAVFLLAVGVFTVLHLRRNQLYSKPEAEVVNRRGRRAIRDLGIVVGVAAVGASLLFLAMQNSLLPGTVDMMAGKMDYGGGPVVASHNHGGHTMTASAGTAGTPVTQLTGPQTGTPDRRVTLMAEKGTIRMDSGKSVDVWTYNGEIPGPELRFREGELVEVTLLNKDIEGGVTIHWHGLDVPNAEDGVAGATQDAVMPGGQHVYRFVADQVGTFWYHSHQNSQEAVQRGLFGPLIIEPRSTQPSSAEDITVMTHVWSGAGFAIGTSDGVRQKQIEPGTKVRLRLINTDDWVIQKYTLVGTPFRVVAIDGESLNKPELLTNTRIELTTGGRMDLEFEMPNKPIYLSVGNSKKLGILMSPSGKADVPGLPAVSIAFDPLNYGEPTATPFNADSKFDRTFEVVLDNKLGFFNGRFNQLYTMNGEVFPNAPMFMVREGELIKVKFVNRGGVDHPMHLHGHHVLVLSRNGVPSTGSPWWSDTLDVRPGDTYEVAFRADNPGIWMDHCHNLQHAKAGMTMHLSYEGVTTPFAIGEDTHNHPE